MKRKGKGKSSMLLSPISTTIYIMVGASIALSFLAAKLILGGTIPIESMDTIVLCLVGIVSFLSCLNCGLRAKRKRFLWAMLGAVVYCMILLLGNLMLFGVAYSNVLPTILTVLCGGLAAAVLAGRKKGKSA